MTENGLDPRSFQDVVMRVAETTGAVVVEYFTCPHCHKGQWSAHLWVERLVCKDCGKPVASKVARPPQPGEVQEKHYRQALEMLHSTYAAQQVVELPPLSREDVAALPAEVQLLLARQSVAVSRHVLEKVAAMTEQLAKLEHNDEEI